MASGAGGSTGISAGGGQDPNVPKLDGKGAREFREYKREVWVWEIETPLPQNKRGAALMRGLSGRAKELVRHIEPSDLFRDDGVKVLLSHLQTIEKESDQKLEEMSERFFGIIRRPGETYEEFLPRADNVRMDLQREDPTFSMSDGMWSLYLLRRCNISPAQRAQVLTITGGTYNREPLYKALRTLGPLFERQHGQGPANN